MSTIHVLLFCIFLAPWPVQPAAAFPFSDLPKTFLTSQGEPVKPGNRAGRQNEPNCNELKPTDALDSVFRNCENIKSSSGFNLDIEKISKEQSAEFKSFTGKLKNIEGVALVIQGNSEIGEVDIPHLLNFSNGGGLSIANNTNLRYVDVRVEGALYIADLNIENNPDLFSFLLIPEGGHIIGSIIFENNRDLAVILLSVTHHWADVVQSQGKFVVNNSPRLESIYLKYLQEIKGLAFLQINNNTKLQKIDVPQITKIEDVGKFEISGNDALVTCYFPRLKVITATDIVISNNAHLGSINFYMLTTVSGPAGQVATLKISQNPMLKTINITPQILKPVNLIIRGNPNLAEDILKQLRTLAMDPSLTKEIQEFGECIFPGVITDLSQLNICGYVYGTLAFASGARGDVTASLKKVIGNISLAYLPEEKLHFLKNTNITGKISTKLCNFTSLYGHKVEGSGGPCTTIPPPTTTATVTDITSTVSEPGTTPRTTTAGKVKLVDPLEPEDYIFLIPKSEQATTASSFSLTEDEKLTIILFIIGGFIFVVALFAFPYNGYKKGEAEEENLDLSTTKRGEMDRSDVERITGMDYRAEVTPRDLSPEEQPSQPTAARTEATKKTAATAGNSGHSVVGKQQTEKTKS